MGSRRFYPYAVKPDAIQLGLQPTSSALVTMADGSLALGDRDATAVGLIAAASLDEYIYDSVIDRSEKADPPVQVVLICRSRESRKRLVFDLQDSEPRNGSIVFQRELSFDLSSWRGEVLLEVVLVRTTTNRDLPPDLGADRGSRLAWSESRRILLSGQRPGPGTNINVEWVRFSEIEHLKPFSEHMWRLTYPPGDPPLLRMNLDMGKEFQDIVEVRYTSGEKLHTQKMVEASIQLQVWSSLLATALERYREETAIESDEFRDDDEIGCRVADMSHGWERDLLLDWAARLFPDYSDPLEKLEESARVDNTSEFRDMLARIGNAAQQYTKAADSVLGFIRRTSSGEEDPPDGLSEDI